MLSFNQLLDQDNSFEFQDDVGPQQETMNTKNSAQAISTADEENIAACRKKAVKTVDVGEKRKAGQYAGLDGKSYASWCGMLKNS